jgi:hypothetical protein
MVPWPIALLALLYAVIATASAVSVWRVMSGASAQPLLWPVAWLTLSASAVYGLALLKPWARTVTLIGFVALSVVTLGVAGVMVATGRPLGGLFATVIVGFYVLAIRYLQRPSVRTYFTENAVKGEG